MELRDRTELVDLVDLIGEARSGNTDAFTDLVRRYQAMAFGCAYVALGDAHLAEDATQQAFLTAYYRLHRLHHPERFAAWLRGIVRFECAHLRRTRRITHLPLEDAADLVESTPGPVETAEDQESLDDLMRIVNSLPQAEREATVLFYIQDYSQREIAAFLNLPVSTVNNRLRSARKRLKHGGLFAMTKDALQHHAPSADFADRIGQVVRTRGTIIDARFAKDSRPPILNALTITDASTNASHTVEVAQYLDDDLVRCIILTTPGQTTPRIDPGTRIVDTASLIQSPLDRDTLADAVAAIRDTPSTPGMQETGIKAIDLLCPLPIGGTVGLAGDMGTGKMVLIGELAHRLSGGSRAPSILVFTEVTTEAAMIQGTDVAVAPTIASVYLPVSDASPEAIGPTMSRLDAVITLTRRLGKHNLYPAIDPIRSTSRLLDFAIVGRDHYDTAINVRTLLNQAAQLPGDNLSPSDQITRHRADLLQHYLTQPFFTTESFTNRPGQFVPIPTTIADCQAILSGMYDHLSPETLFMIGSIADTITNG